MHILLVLKGNFMQDLVVLLLLSETVLIASIVSYLLEDRVLCIGRTNKLVRHLDFIKTALIEQLHVLTVAYHALFALFQALPLLIFNHRGVCVHVLSLQFDFFQFLSQPSIFSCLFFLLRADVIISFLQAFFSCGHTGLFPDSSVFNLS